MSGLSLKLSALNQRRWINFRRNGRGFWSLWIILVLFVLSLFAYCAKLLRMRREAEMYAARGY